MEQPDFPSVWICWREPLEKISTEAVHIPPNIEPQRHLLLRGRPGTTGQQFCLLLKAERGLLSAFKNRGAVAPLFLGIIPLGFTLNPAMFGTMFQTRERKPKVSD